MTSWYLCGFRIASELQKIKSGNSQGLLSFSFHRSSPGKIIRKVPLFYMQIHIAPEDQHKTTFTCSFGTFAYTCMPFGLCNVPSTFQRCMTSIFSDLL
ncbi:hypothetical protein CR513_41405, partial [Mucuna pruriens]